MEYILFDGVCNLCNSAVNFIIDHDPERRFRFASIQSETGRVLIARYALESVDSLVLVQNGWAFTKSDAALHIARHLGGGWSMLAHLRWIPRPLRDAIYDWVARNRYRLFGKSAACRIPTPELKDRFLE